MDLEHPDDDRDIKAKANDVQIKTDRLINLILLSR